MYGRFYRKIDVKIHKTTSKRNEIVQSDRKSVDIREKEWYIYTVRSTKGCLACNLLAWGCQNLTTYNVTVIIVTRKLLSVGERQLPFLFTESSVI